MPIWKATLGRVLVRSAFAVLISAAITRRGVTIPDAVYQAQTAVDAIVMWAEEVFDIRP